MHNLCNGLDTYLFLLFIEVIDDNTNKKVEGEEWPEDDKEDEIDVHVNVDLTNRLLTHLVMKKH